MNSIKDALLSAFRTDAIVKINDIEGNEKKRQIIFQIVRSSLASRYKIVTDPDKGEIYVQYK